MDAAAEVVELPNTRDLCTLLFVSLALLLRAVALSMMEMTPAFSGLPPPS
jgi:hypothetical protein